MIRLEPLRNISQYCGGYGESCAAIHDLEERRIRDLPVFEHRVELIVPRVRVACPRFGPRLKRLSWIEPYARVTQRLAESVGRLCKVMAIRHLARFFGLDWKMVKRIDRMRLERARGPIDLDGIEAITLDEFAIQNGHGYATVVVEPTRKRVLWVGCGRGREDIRLFFELLGAERCRRLRATVMDMSAGSEREVRAHCPNAAIVFDLFHVVAKYCRDAIDRVCVDRANALRGDRPGRRVVKGARWLLLKSRNSLRPGKDVQLEELLAANHDLFVIYVLRNALEELWTY